MRIRQLQRDVDEREQGRGRALWRLARRGDADAAATVDGEVDAGGRALTYIS